MKRRTALRTFGSAAVIGGAGCLGGGDSNGPKEVRMVDLQFKPAEFSIQAGRTVRWVNESDIAHTVTAYGNQLPERADYWASGGFETEEAARTNLADGLINTDGTYRHTFETAGDHAYFCVPHEGSGMTGTVSVQ